MCTCINGCVWINMHVCLTDTHARAHTHTFPVLFLYKQYYNTIKPSLPVGLSPHNLSWCSHCITLEHIFLVHVYSCRYSAKVCSRNRLVMDLDFPHDFLIANIVTMNNLCIWHCRPLWVYLGKVLRVRIIEIKATVYVVRLHIKFSWVVSFSLPLVMYESAWWPVGQPSMENVVRILDVWQSGEKSYLRIG